MWEAALTSLSGAADSGENLGLGLQFEVTTAGRVGMRPVLPGYNGWVKGGVSWRTLERVFRSHPHLELLLELRAQFQSGPHYRFYVDERLLHLDEFPTRRVWDVLLEAQQTGLPLVTTGRAAEPVTVRPEPVGFAVHAGREGADLRLRPVLTAGDTALDPARLALAGDPAHGVAWWDLARGKPVSLHLAPLARPVRAEQVKALAEPPIVVPVADEPRFLRQYYPGLAKHTTVVAVDKSVTLPDPNRSTVTLVGRLLPGHRLELSWEWDPPTATNPRVDELVTDPRYGLTTRGKTVVAGDVMLRVLRELVPRLREIPDVVVDLDLDETGYVETTEAPVVTFSDQTDGDGKRDWFDLAIRVTVDGEEVGFRDLFVALAREQEFLILPSGRYVTLDRPEFHRLHELIVESLSLHDTPPGVLRVGRLQPGVWQDVTDLGELSGPAAAWLESIRDPGETPRVPPGVHATLRGYQEDGFAWLATLYRHGLGGVLADDMGLGKTLQTLAMIVHAGADVPFLVVAPASVVGNWVAESARFAPDLAVHAVRRTGELAAVAPGTRIVVTSYTLFRLEYDEYAAMPWAGLILDEAQFVKNAGSLAYQCARDLPVGFKLAITGTPVENHLAELWALLSITSPGLLPRLDRFTDHYRRPIERDRDQQRLAQLRRRIRPLMLRRRKSEVAADLPDKQEQILELELNPRQRRVYQAYLQRERRKVLGLLGDLRRNRFEIFRSLTLLRQAALDVALVDDEHQGVPSTKLDALAERVTDIVAEGHRILVFSQFTRFLDAARQRLEAAGIACSYLDGKTSRRTEVIDGFKSGTAPVFLISLKAGGFGLNLTEADYCIMLDPWWNPATEAQAVDRVHRIGQTRNVMVYRLVASDTIEEKVMALQARKAELSGSVLDGGDFASAEMTAADIQGLLD
ncbi:DEAD/DEAH box helicase [Actinoplanes couchii]|uniref:DNA helicase n=1 Tax=Actinoplanes couchii TaxID=403638 RepID=A0ABQ3XGD1_9ACTN|nr:DEAD/DEAH box helicase [Actinoplanes couchii]MDR6321051.1 superfamily II DNA or RNA helicase [Actinoplanes couchii]GID57562.1 DNA helicase [Actinoplanes couchii]